MRMCELASREAAGQKEAELKVLLESLYETYHHPRFLSSDPLEWVTKFSSPADQEIVGVLASQLAYGNVKQIRKSVVELLGRLRLLAPRPAEAIEFWGVPGNEKRIREILRGFQHRFQDEDDLGELLRLVQETRREEGSLALAFSRHLRETGSVPGALSAWIGDWKKRSRLGKKASFQHFLAAPSAGSACKRWCMYLRWMIRRDELDPGPWAEIVKAEGFGPADLILPLDTHTSRIGRYIGLTNRKASDWKTALEVTGNLKTLCPEDPVRYDFAISRLGILDECRHRFVPEICGRCSLEPACRYAMESRNDDERKSRPAA